MVDLRCRESVAFVIGFVWYFSCCGGVGWEIGADSWVVLVLSEVRMLKVVEAIIWVSCDVFFGVGVVVADIFVYSVKKMGGN